MVNEVKYHPIDEYLHGNRMTQKELAKSLGCTPGLVSQWVSGYSSVTAAWCVAIEKATKGTIKRVELRPDIFG